MLGTTDLFPLQLLVELVSYPSCLSCISPLLATTDNQFGFKSKHGTGMSIFLLKQTVSYYVSKDTPVFSAFLVKHLKHLIELTTTYFLLN